MNSPTIMTSNIRYLKRLGLTAALAVMVIGSATAPAMADWDHRGHDDYHYGHNDPHFRGFKDRDWHGGRWFHGVRDGRPGWWWTVGGHYFYYPQPVYPYPANPYAPQVVYAPPTVVQAPPPPSPGINLIVPLNIR